MQIDTDSPGVRFPPPFIFLGTLLAALAVDYVAGPATLGLPATFRVAFGLALPLCGILVLIWAATLFRRKGTNIEPWRSTTAILADGPYRWSRNPIYAAMVLTYTGIALGFDSIVALLALVPVIFIVQTQVIAREEDYLEAKFGDEYRTYKASVRRWI